jgi:hypothetical protein
MASYKPVTDEMIVLPRGKSISMGDMDLPSSKKKASYKKSRRYQDE